MISSSLKGKRILILIYSLIGLLVSSAMSVSANPVVPWYAGPFAIPIIIIINFPINFIFLHLFLMIGNHIQGKATSHDITEKKNLFRLLLTAIFITMCGGVIDYTMIEIGYTNINGALLFGFILVFLTVLIFTKITLRTDLKMSLSLSILMSIMNLGFWGVGFLLEHDTMMYCGLPYFTYFALFLYVIIIFMVLQRKNRKDAEIEERIEQLRIGNIK